jgi:hypothetical protein
MYASVVYMLFEFPLPEEKQSTFSEWVGVHAFVNNCSVIICVGGWGAAIWVVRSVCFRHWLNEIITCNLVSLYVVDLLFDYVLFFFMFKFYNTLE